MAQTTNNLISLRELAKELGMEKSTLHFYTSMGLIHPEIIIGKTHVYNKDVIIKRINKIKEYTGKGKTLKQIKNILDENNKRAK